MERKVSGERIAAAVIDAIIVSVIALIPMALMGAIYGFENALELAFLQENPLEPTSDYINFIVISLGIETIIGILYFALLPFLWNGQTLGKRFLGIKAINEFGENPSFIKHLVRAIQNWGAYVMFPLSFLIFVNYLTYFVLSTLLWIIPGIIILVSMIMLLSREDGKGLHDLLAGTNVVKVSSNVNQDFIEKTTQMSEWADVVDGKPGEDKEKDAWDI